MAKAKLRVKSARRLNKKLRSVPQEVVKAGTTANGRFAPGNQIGVGHPGRHRDFITQQLISVLNETDERVPGGKTKIRRAVEKLVDQAIEGNVHAFVAMCDQVQGRPKTRIDIQGFDGFSAIRIETVLVEKDADGKVIDHEPVRSNPAETEVHFEDEVRSNNEATPDKEEV